MEMDILRQPQDSEEREREKIIASINVETIKELTDQHKDDPR